ncbi:MAG: SH3 domain-containing protein [Pyrinomonadaceae bacterium]
MRYILITLLMAAVFACDRVSPEAVNVNNSATSVSSSPVPVTAANANPKQVPAAKEEVFVRPVDEGESDPSFSAFRKKLIEAANKRDAEYILSILDPKIKNSFGGDGGIEEFKEAWKINSPDSKFWGELLAAISNGGYMSNEKDQFSAPYLFEGLPDNLDPFEHEAIFGKDVRLRAKPDLDSEVVATLSYNVVRVDNENSVKKENSDSEFSWLKVETLGGLKGFVKAEFVRSSIDYRALFAKQDGEWKMDVFIAGD